MPKPYSYDLRQKVIQAVELDGLKKSEASELFNISRNTINLWLQRKAQTGDVQALPNRPRGNNHKITDWEQFRAFAKTHGDKTQARNIIICPFRLLERSQIFIDCIHLLTLHQPGNELRVVPEIAQPLPVSTHEDVADDS
jgi:transposase